ncbi:RNA-binding S4 domain-containing protein [Agrococcus lahaulensis]|uniref:RNA-binding S4 domain-containing protein n=1 Tax=Agrococcus sp. SCSIO52902 TaxID=2933290 RepID=UPI000FE427CE|nr:S4 domain-containing protein [Agrococcus sp. SCSIO52902]RWR22796.1 RNA-binding S4 domain-containing protein [Agrococcus lahaulensis]UOW01427.1 RNA-binding S4 domain-containing protein [Agrococcus sp. SCSIO52902]
MSERVRLDVWIWAVRLVKTRAAATAACRGGHVKLNGQAAKAAQPVRIGDEVRVRISGFDRVVGVQQLLSKRVSAPLAAAAIDDRSPERPTAIDAAQVPRRAKGAGRPSSRERREIDRLRGREG